MVSKVYVLQLHILQQTTLIKRYVSAQKDFLNGYIVYIVYLLYSDIAGGINFMAKLSL